MKISGCTFIDRQYLYKIVWSKPADGIVGIFKISEKTVIARCVELQIPMPSEGYWRAVAKGAAPHVSELPPFKHKESINPSKQPDVPPANEFHVEQPVPSGLKPALKGRPKSSTRFIHGEQLFSATKEILLKSQITELGYSVVSFKLLIVKVQIFTNLHY